jgi:hypothetical protein
MDDRIAASIIKEQPMEEFPHFRDLENGRIWPRNEVNYYQPRKTQETKNLENQTPVLGLEALIATIQDEACLARAIKSMIKGEQVKRDSKIEK